MNKKFEYFKKIFPLENINNIKLNKPDFAISGMESFAYYLNGDQIEFVPFRTTYYKGKLTIQYDSAMSKNFTSKHNIKNLVCYKDNNIFGWRQLLDVCPLNPFSDSFPLSDLERHFGEEIKRLKINEF